MYTILQPLAGYFRVKSVKTYDCVFALHSKVTVVFLFACTVIISAKEYFGAPIHCLADEKMKSFVTNYCWVFGTYIIDDTNLLIGKQSISHGVSGGNDDKKIYQRYYQWIVLILILQATIFMIPSFLWKIWEGGRLSQLCSGLDSVFAPEEWYTKKKDMLALYFTGDFHGVHLCYALKYFFCELLHFIICSINIILMNVFFTGFWHKFAPALGTIPLYDWDEWDRHSSRVFPKMAKCLFFKFGNSGDIQWIDALCLLPLNILNEKLFAFLFCWFLLLTVISGLNVIYRIFVMCSHCFRLKLMRAHIGSISQNQINTIFRNMNVGDWFVLHKVSTNINGALFRDLMERLYELKKGVRDF